MTYTTHPETRIGHIHLRVADLERAINFYRDVMGFKLQQKFADSAAFLAAGDYHHHIGLNTWASKGGTAAPPGHSGLFHTAFLYPNRAALGAALQKVIDANVTIDGAADHGVSEAIYFTDPDGNGIEIYRDRDMNDWPKDATGGLQMVNSPLDLEALLAEVPR